ncbi:hypothetical protein ACIBQX_04525 [Nonomuraea sp. NPDC049714]|uniref:hypothetical protein n=1 Tax=Nonomuraea sp. NPDC049714 TaxID=3364357 RepID=UPI0037998854
MRDLLNEEAATPTLDEVMARIAADEPVPYDPDFVRDILTAYDGMYVALAELAGSAVAHRRREVRRLAGPPGRDPPLRRPEISKPLSGLSAVFGAFTVDDGLVSRSRVRHEVDQDVTIRPR